MHSSTWALDWHSHEVSSTLLWTIKVIFYFSPDHESQKNGNDEAKGSKGWLNTRALHLMHCHWRLMLFIIITEVTFHCSSPFTRHMCGAPSKASSSFLWCQFTFSLFESAFLPNWLLTSSSIDRSNNFDEYVHRSIEPVPISNECEHWCLNTLTHSIHLSFSRFLSCSPSLNLNYPWLDERKRHTLGQCVLILATAAATNYWSTDQLRLPAYPFIWLNRTTIYHPVCVLCVWQGNRVHYQQQQEESLYGSHLHCAD